MRRPKGRKYHNLYVPAGRATIWYARVVGGRRYRANTKQSPEAKVGWDDAALWRDEYEALKGIGAGAPLGAVPTFGDLVAAYFDSQKFGRLAATTRQDRRSHLAEEGPVVAALGRKKVDEITADTLCDWWEQTARERSWSVDTGFRYLSTIAEVLKGGRRFLHGRTLPTVEARQRIGEQRRTAAGRAASGPRCRPIRDPDAIAELLAAAAAQGTEAHAFVLVLLDGGLRKGEALALRWRAVAWGADDADPRRHLLVRASRSRGAEEEGTTKSGRTRRVGLSRRLRGALEALYLEQRPASLDAYVFPGLHAKALRALWPAIVGGSSLPGVAIKDLRDTFGSWLLTLGVPIQFVSRQLGHGSIAVTETHYAQYLGRDGDEFLYVEPPKLGAGEVPADLLARIGDCSQPAHSGDPYALPESLKPAGIRTKSARMQSKSARMQ